MNRKTTLGRIRSQSGMAAVEFALVLPFFLLLLLGMFDFGKSFNYWIDGTHLSHEGARFAAVAKVPPGGQDLRTYIRDRADSNELKSGSSSITEPIEVCIAFPEGKAVGNPVEVKVTFTYQFLGYVNTMLPDITTATISNTSTMRIERPPTDVPEGCLA